MDEDALNNFNKDPMPENAPVASSVQSSPETSSSSVQSTSETTLSSMPSVTNMPAFNKNAIPLHPVPQNSQVANSSMPFVTGVPTFPIQGFSMSGNMVQNACKHDCMSVSNIPEALQSGPVHPCCRMGDSKFSCNLQLGAVLSSDQFQGSSAFTAALGTDYKPGHHASEVSAEDCALSMAQPFQKAERFIYEGNKMKDNLNINSVYQKGTLVSPSGPADKVDQVETSEACLLKMSSIEKGSCLTGTENSGSIYRTIPGPCIKCPGGNEVYKSSQISVDPLQADLLIGKSLKLIEPELSIGASRIDPETVDDASSFVVAGAELSLSLSSSRDKELNDSLSVAEEASDTNYDTLSLDQIFGGNGSQDRKDEMIMKMFHRAREIETQLQEWTEWAQQKVMQAARRLSKEKAELKALRQEREEIARLKKEKQAVEESNMKKLSEMDNALRKAKAQMERGNATVSKLEEENKKLRQEMDAAKLIAIESAVACLEVSKREKKTLKKFQAWERQKAMLQEELTSEKRKLASLQQQLVKAKERQLQIEVRWRQEEKSKEEAIMRATTEKQAKEQIEAATKRKEDALHQKAEMDTQRYRDEVQRLEHEITQLRFTTESSKLAAMQWDSNQTVSSCPSDTNSIQILRQTNTRLLSEIAELQDLSHSEVQRDRECVMCLSEERSVVFLPCAHQVVCTKCNELHGKQGMNDCPSCRTPIQQRVCVHSANS
ncbi:hypothetical protein SUGI_0223370 [Cryptomeria japonica]|nr:hypothetical protein SUGI_0223370 [Cryptomeria japonica]